MPSVIWKEKLKILRALNIVLLIALIVLFLTFTDKVWFYDQNDLGIAYVAFGGLLVLCAVDLLSQLAKEQIPPTPMCLLCVLAGTLLLTVAVKTLIRLANLASPAHPKSRTEHEYHMDSRSKSVAAALATISIAAAVVFLAEAIFWIRQIWDTKMRVHPLPRADALRMVPVPPPPDAAADAHGLDLGMGDGAYRNVAAKVLFTEVKCIHVRPAVPEYAVYAFETHACCPCPERTPVPSPRRLQSPSHSQHDVDGYQGGSEHDTQRNACCPCQVQKEALEKKRSQARKCCECTNESSDEQKKKKPAKKQKGKKKGRAPSESSCPSGSSCPAGSSCPSRQSDSDGETGCCGKKKKKEPKKSKKGGGKGKGKGRRTGCQVCDCPARSPTKGAMRSGSSDQKKDLRFSPSTHSCCPCSPPVNKCCPCPHSPKAGASSPRSPQSPKASGSSLQKCCPCPHSPKASTSSPQKCCPCPHNPKAGDSSTGDHTSPKKCCPCSERSLEKGANSTQKADGKGRECCPCSRKAEQANKCCPCEEHNKHANADQSEGSSGEAGCCGKKKKKPEKDKRGQGKKKKTKKKTKKKEEYDSSSQTSVAECRCDVQPCTCVCGANHAESAGSATASDRPGTYNLDMDDAGGYQSPMFYHGQPPPGGQSQCCPCPQDGHMSNPRSQSSGNESPRRGRADCKNKQCSQPHGCIDGPFPQRSPTVPRQVSPTSSPQRQVSETVAWPDGSRKARESRLTADQRARSAAPGGNSPDTCNEQRAVRDSSTSQRRGRRGSSTARESSTHVAREGSSTARESSTHVAREGSSTVSRKRSSSTRDSSAQVERNESGISAAARKESGNSAASRKESGGPSLTKEVSAEAARKESGTSQSLKQGDVNAESTKSGTSIAPRECTTTVSRCSESSVAREGSAKLAQKDGSALLQQAPLTPSGQGPSSARSSPERLSTTPANSGGKVSPPQSGRRSAKKERSSQSDTAKTCSCECSCKNKSPDSALTCGCICACKSTKSTTGPVHSCRCGATGSSPASPIVSGDVYKTSTSHKDYSLKALVERHSEEPASSSQRSRNRAQASVSPCCPCDPEEQPASASVRNSIPKLNLEELNTDDDDDDDDDDTNGDFSRGNYEIGASSSGAYENRNFVGMDMSKRSANTDGVGKSTSNERRRQMRMSSKPYAGANGLGPCGRIGQCGSGRRRESPKIPVRPTKATTLARAARNVDEQNVVSSYGGTFHMSKDVAPISSVSSYSSSHSPSSLAGSPVSIPGQCFCADGSGSDPPYPHVHHLDHTHPILFGCPPGGQSSKASAVEAPCGFQECPAIVDASDSVACPKTESMEWVNVPGYFKRKDKAKYEFPWCPRKDGRRSVRTCDSPRMCDESGSGNRSPCCEGNANWTGTAETIFESPRCRDFHRNNPAMYPVESAPFTMLGSQERIDFRNKDCCPCELDGTNDYMERLE